MSHEKYGAPESAPEITTLFKMWHHPLNPTYTSVQTPKLKTLPQFGYALVEEELCKRELDDDILSKENEILQQRLMEGEDTLKGGSHVIKRKLVIGSDLNGNECDNINGDLNSNYLDSNNNSCKVSKRNKSTLNVEEAESCPGLATSAVTYKEEWTTSNRQIRDLRSEVAIQFRKISFSIFVHCKAHVNMTLNSSNRATYLFWFGSANIFGWGEIVSKEIRIKKTIKFTLKSRKKTYFGIAAISQNFASRHKKIWKAQRFSRRYYNDSSQTVHN